MAPQKDHLKTVLDKLLKQSQGQDITVEAILRSLAGRGQAALIVLFSLPFCQPLQIPGFSTPFGIAIMFIGFRIAFRKRAWLPQFVLKKTVSQHVLQNFINISLKVIDKLSFFISPRLVWLTRDPILCRIHGLMIVLLGFIFALPLPIPLSNLLAAYPLLLFGLGILEQDGVAIIVAYTLSFVCFLALGALFWLGKEGISTALGL